MDGLDKSFSVAEGIVAAEETGKNPEQKNCLNCDAPLHGTFCHACGQKNLPRRQDIGDFIINFISSFNMHGQEKMLSHGASSFQFCTTLLG